MARLSLLLALAIFIPNLFIALELFRGSRRIRFLRDISPASTGPLISIVFAARNEERKIREGIASFLHQDYPNLEIIAVNDRSTDRTGDILDVAAAEDARLRVVQVTELPSGWLGKNYALRRGAGISAGEYILFTDADIVMDHSTVARAVSYVQARRLDHLALAPSLSMPTPVLRAFGLAFSLSFSLFTRPWRAPNPKSSCHIGIGAFNLIRATAYRSVGTHEAIRLRPDDDLKLGKILKRHGFAQEMVYGTGLVTVEWYSSVRETIDGLMKNAFSGVDYRLSVTIAGVLSQALFTLWPFLALVVIDGPVRLLYAATVAIILLTGADGARLQGLPYRYVLALPAATALFLYILMRAAYRNLRDGGITWRDTFYPLSKLRKNRV